MCKFRDKAPIKTGLILDETPEYMRGEESIDLYTMVATLWRAVQELKQENDQLKERIEKLETTT